MSLKDWMKRVEGAQLSENITPQAATTKPGMNSTAAQQTAQNTNKLSQGLSKVGITQNTAGVAKALSSPPGVNSPATDKTIAGVAKNIGLDQLLADPTSASKLAPMVKNLAAQNAQQNGQQNQPGLQEEEVSEVAPPGMEKAVLALKKKFPGNPQRAFATAWSMYNKKHGKTEESMMESKQLNEGTLEEIIGNHPHEHKMCQEGWGMDNSLFEALADHYYKEGRIPRSVWHGSAEELREFVESCYAKDTMGSNEGAINSGMLDEEGVAEGIGGDMAKLIGIPVVAGAAAIGAQYYDDQQPHVQVGGQNAKIVRADSSRIPDNAMIITGKDGKQYRVWQQSGKGMSKITFAAPVQGTNEGVAEGTSDSWRDIAGDKIKQLKNKGVFGNPGTGTGKDQSWNDSMTDIARDKLHKLNPKKEQGVAEGSKEDLTMAALDLEPNLKMRAQHKAGEPSFLDRAGKAVGAAMKKTANKVINTFGGPGYEELETRSPRALDEETSELEQMLRQSTKESAMYESKSKKISENTGVTDYNPKSQGGTRKELLAKYAKSGSSADATAARKAGATQDELKAARTKSVAEAVEKTKTGIKHKADAGGYGRKDDEEDTDEDGKKIKKVKKNEPKKERGRPDKDAGDLKVDFSAFTSDIKLKPWDKKKTTVKKMTTKADSDEYDDNGNLIPKKDKPKGTTTSRRKKVGEALKGKQSKLDINKNGKVDGGDFAMLRGQKKKDAQMESWDRQLKGLLTEGRQLNEGLTVSTSVGNEGGNDTVSITASDADAHQLLQMLQNAGMGSGVPHHAVQASTAPAQVLPKDGQPTVGSIAVTDGPPNAGAQKDIDGAGKSVPIMAMPRGMAFSVNDDSKMPTEPGEFGTLDQEEVVSALGSEQGSADDSGDDALAAIKKLMGQHGASEVTAKEFTPPESKVPAAPEQETEVEESDTDGKKPDEDGDGVPDWADKKKGKDDNADSKDDEDDSKDDEDDSEDDEDDSEDDEEVKEGFDFADATANEIEKHKKVDEGKESCNECGGLMEDDHECGQLNEWSNSPQGQSADEQFESDMKFMQDVISAGLNGRKSTGQATTPVLASQTNRQMSEGYNIDVAAEMRKLAGIR